MDELKISYTEDFETLLKDEGEKCEAMSILHSRCHSRYNYFSIFINIPVIVLSSVIGFLSTINLFDNQEIFLGALSITVAIMKALESYFSWNTRSETHRVMGLGFSKISKFIQIQLSLEREVRIQASDLLDIITNDVQNLFDQQPIIPDKIIREFNIRYKSDLTTKPPITNGLTHIKINRNLLSPKPEAFQIDIPEILETIPEEKPKPKARWKP